MTLTIVLLDDDGSELGRFDSIPEAEAAMNKIDAERWELETV